MEITGKQNEFKKLENDNNCKLIVKKVTSELKGQYTCKVENEYGSAETTAKLTVHCEFLKNHCSLSFLLVLNFEGY